MKLVVWSYSILAGVIIFVVLWFYCNRKFEDVYYLWDVNMPVRIVAEEDTATIYLGKCGESESRNYIKHSRRGDLFSMTIVINATDKTIGIESIDCRIFEVSLPDYKVKIIDKTGCFIDRKNQCFIWDNDTISFYREDKKIKAFTIGPYSKSIYILNTYPTWQELEPLDEYDQRHMQIQETIE